MNMRKAINMITTITADARYAAVSAPIVVFHAAEASDAYRADALRARDRQRRRTNALVRAAALDPRLAQVDRVEEDTGEQVTMFCSFKVETSRLPYRMGGRFKCEEPLLEASEDPSIAFGATTLGGGALSLHGGMADVLHGSECEEPNCLLCVKH